MEDVDSLLLMSLSSVPSCSALSSISDLMDSGMLLQVCIECLAVCLPGEDLPKSVPSLVTAKYQLCILITKHLKALGFRGDIGFNMFLYPNVKDLRVLMSFIAEKLPKEEEKQETVQAQERPLVRKIKASLRAWMHEDWMPPFDLHPVRPLQPHVILALPSEASVARELLPLYRDYQQYRTSSYLSVLRAAGHSFASSIAQEVTLHKLHEAIDSLTVRSEPVLPPLQLESSMPTSSDILGQTLHEEAAGDVEDTGGFFSHELEFAQEVEVAAPAAPTAKPAVQDLSSRWVEETQGLEQRLEALMQEEANSQAAATALASTIDTMRRRQEEAKSENADLAKELEKKHTAAVLLTSAAATNLTKLRQEIEESQRKLDEMKRNWEEYRAPLVEEVRTKRERIEKLKENYTDKIEEIKQMKEELQEMASEAQMKDEMMALLSEEEAKSSTKLNRNLFILRTTEVIDKLKRQKREIAKIVKDVQDLQSSISFNRDTLRRVDSATEDLVFQEAKKDAGAKAMYKMLMDLRTIYDELIRLVEEQNSVKSTLRDVEMRMDSVKARSSAHDLQRLREDLRQIKEEARKH